MRPVPKNPKAKKICYETYDCGPVVKTGFQYDEYWVCTKCKEEICDNLKEVIDNRNILNNIIIIPEEDYDFDI